MRVGPVAVLALNVRWSLRPARMLPIVLLAGLRPLMLPLITVLFRPAEVLAGLRTWLLSWLPAGLWARLATGVSAGVGTRVGDMTSGRTLEAWAALPTRGSLRTRSTVPTGSLRIRDDRVRIVRGSKRLTRIGIGELPVNHLQTTLRRTARSTQNLTGLLRSTHVALPCNCLCHAVRGLIGCQDRQNDAD